MITIYIEPNTITPFVDSVEDSPSLINFEVKSRYYVPYSNLSVDDIFNNEYYDTYETNDIRDKKALQITTRITQIKPALEDNISYGFSLKLSPEINEIKHPTSKFFTNLREQENFNNFIDNFKASPIFEWEERRFTDTETDVFSVDNSLILNTDSWDDSYKKNYQIIKRLLSTEFFEKTTSIQYLSDSSIRGLNDDFKMMYPYFHLQGPFNEVFNGYCLPVVYNEKLGYWENTSTLKILNNYWEKILLNLEDQERYSFISKLLYPIITNNDIRNFYFGAYLEPFEIRDILEWKVRPKNLLNGIKLSFVEAGVNARGNVNVVSDVITASNNMNSYNDNVENFSDIINVALQTTSYEFQRRSNETNTIFDRNGSITNDVQFVITELDSPYPLWDQTINFNFLNVDEHIDPIQPFNDDNRAENYVNTISFYDDITNEDIKNNILQTLSDNFFNRKGIVDNNAVYSPNGYDVDKSINPTGRDSKVYLGLKE